MTQPDIEQLKKRLDAAIERSNPSDNTTAGVVKGYSEGTNTIVRTLLEFVLPIIVGVVVGIVLDREFATAPLFLIIFILLGLGSGFMNMYRIAKQDSASNDPPEDS